MKKLLMILAACATAMVAPAAVKTQVDFESENLGGFTGNGYEIKEYPNDPNADTPDQTYPFSGNNTQYCAVDADSEYTLKGPAGSGATCFDMYVQFPVGATTPEMDSLGDDAKVAVYLDYDENNKVCVVSGNGSGGTTITKIETTVVAVAPGEWVRLTIAKVVGGYKVYINGVDVKSSAPFTAISSDTAPTKVDFAGCGNLDNYVARTTDPFVTPADWVACETGATDPEQYYTDYTAALTYALNGASLTFNGGMDGTPDHPYEITCLADLKAFQTAVAGKKGLDKCYKLTADIALDAAWPGIGIQNGKDLVSYEVGTGNDKITQTEADKRDADWDAGAFCGTFDGQNHTISNFQMVDGLDYCGFFNSVDGATIKNLKISYKDGSFAKDMAAAKKVCGATFVGVANASTLQNLTSLAGTVSCTKGFGGIVGYLMAGSTVDSCTNNVNLTSTATNKCGGVAMITQKGTGTATIRNCQNNGTVAGSEQIGSLVGYVSVDTTIANCDSTVAYKLLHHNSGALTVSGITANASVASYTGVNTPGLNFATVDGTVATFVADDAVAAGATQYKVMNANATYAFASAGSLALNEAITNATVTIASAQSSSFALSSSTSDSVTTYIAAAATTVDMGEDIPDIKIPDTWIATNIKEGATAEEIREALNEEETNGLTKWENYVLGQDSSTPVKVNVEQSATLMMPVGSTLKPQTADIGCTVKYSLAKVNASGTVVDSGTQQDATDFSIDLSEITSSAFFRVTASVSGTGGSDKVIASDNVIGVLVVNDAPATTLIGVPFASLGDDGSISISDLVRTANLSDGDTISAYDSSSHKFRTWAFNKTTGVWSPAGVGGADPAEADTIKIGRGKGVWLTRQHPETPIYLVGELATDAVSSTLEAGSESGKTWNIVAPPSAEAFDLNNAKLVSTASADDQIIVPTKGAPKNFTLKNGKWGYEKKELGDDGLYHSVRTEEATVPAGRGFWYINSTNKTSIGL